MARVYREARGGMIDASEASRLAYILSSIGKLIEATDIENRLQQLERKLLYRRLEILENKMPRRSDPGYKIVMRNDGETAQEAITRAGLVNWPPDRIILIGFVKAGL